MGDDPFSPLWYRVSSLRPRLAPGTRISRHRYRGESWYVLQDPVTGRVHRFTPPTYWLLAAMDGRRTLDEIWRAAAERLGDAAPTQDELIQLLGQLHAVDAVHCDISPDVLEASERGAAFARRRWLSRLGSPLFMRFPLWDPDRFLERLLPRLRWASGWPLAAAWFMLVGSALVLAGMHWEELTANLSDRVLSAGNLLALWLVFPAVKLLHELGHAVATKARGGEVHEIGVMLLVFTPIPYVDSTAANAFRSKLDRALVGAAGMLVETALAAVAMFVWASVEPGWIRAMSFNVMLIAGVSTVVFNLNPLLRFDGYYILSDVIEIPNLAARSKRFLTEWIDRRLFGATIAQPLRLAPGEAPWLALYQPLSSLYRLTVMLSIALFLATRFFFIGVALAIWALLQGVAWPLAKGLWHVLGAPGLQQHRRRAVTVTVGAVALLGALLFAVPAPNRVMTEGVVWPPDDAQIRAQSNGFIERLNVTAGQAVAAGAELLRVGEPALDAQLLAQAARLDQALAELNNVLFSDRTRAELARQAVDAERAALDRLLSEFERQSVIARSEGVVHIVRAVDLPGRYVRNGDLLGFISRGDNRTIRIVLPQEDVERVRGRVRAVAVRLAPESSRVVDARFVREVPAGRDELPSRALAIEGGGPFEVDPRERDGRRTLNRVFQFDVELAEPAAAPMGARAYVRIDLPAEPLGQQAYRRLRQLLLARLDV